MRFTVINGVNAQCVAYNVRNGLFIIFIFVADKHFALDLNKSIFYYYFYLWFCLSHLYCQSCNVRNLMCSYNAIWKLSDIFESNCMQSIRLKKKYEKSLVIFHRTYVTHLCCQKVCKNEFVYFMKNYFLFLFMFTVSPVVVLIF